MISDNAALVAALAIGVVFGWFLERGGLGSARKLMGQFYLTDFTVFKVMFSAVITAMLGSFWLAWLGFLDLSRVFVPETWWVAQLAGGVIFGAGFAIAGLCPGTSCVAASTGRKDGLLVVVGMLLGVFTFHELFRLFEPVYEGGALGQVTLADALDLRYGTVVLIVTTAALAGFAVAERIERRATSPITGTTATTAAALSE
jgi:uncharacterized membrane protein YedE/YeeE